MSGEFRGVRRLINLTPHPIIIVGEDCPSVVESAADINSYILITIAPSGMVARVNTTRERAGELFGIPVYAAGFSEVVGLPEPREGVMYIVSTLVLQALRGKRSDLLAPDTSPAGAVRDKNGRIVAVKGLQVIR